MRKPKTAKRSLANNRKLRIPKTTKVYSATYIIANDRRWRMLNNFVTSDLDLHNYHLRNGVRIG